jgi:hypothetical protein
MEHLTGKPGGICKFSECGLPYYSLGYCIGHYRQFKRGRELRPLYRREATMEGRFWSKVEKTDGCWNWVGSLTAGYGRISVDGVLQLAHRVSFTWANGPIPDGMLVDHRCHQTACVRPDHLRLATVKQNQENRCGATRESTTGIRGVFQTRSGKFTAQVNASGELHYLGTFETLDAAEAAVIAKRTELFTHNDLDRI